MKDSYNQAKHPNSSPHTSPHPEKSYTKQLYSERVVYDSNMTHAQMQANHSKIIESQPLKVSIKLPKVSKHGGKTLGFNGSAQDLSGSQLSFSRSRKKSPKVIKFQNKDPLSSKNRIMIVNFLQKLKLVENFAVYSPHMTQEYLNLIGKFKRKENQYQQILQKEAKPPVNSIQDQKAHYSLKNIELRADLTHDISLLRDFATKHRYPLYRKDVITNSFGYCPSILGRLNSLCQDSVSPSQATRKISFSLNRNTNSLNKTQNSQQKVKIKFIKEIVHHCRVDNRFIRINTSDFEEQKQKQPIFVRKTQE